MSRKYEYINISTPKIRAKPGLSHDLQLLRDLEIANARTLAELGPLPPGGLPIVPKDKFIPPQTAAMPTQTSLENQEEAMELNRIAAVAVLATGIAACEPSEETVAAEQMQITAPVVKQAEPVASEIHTAPMVAVVSERATNDAALAVPDEIRAFMPQDSTLLAYKRFDLTGDGNEDAVLIVRHPVTETYADYSKNPCDLIVLHAENEGLKLAGKSSKAIDCTYVGYTRERASRPDDLNEFIELKSLEISCYNEMEKGGNSTYRFKYSKKRGVWHLYQVEDVHGRSDENEIRVFEQKASYPRDFGWISMDGFDPESERLLAVLLRNEKEVE